MEAATMMAIGSLLGGTASILNVAGVFGGGGDSAAPPSPSTPAVMPTPDDDATKAAKRKQLSALSQRRGRQSTILSEPVSSDLLGG